MKRLASLLQLLEAQPALARQRAALAMFWRECDGVDAVSALQLLRGRGVGRVVSVASLREAACRRVGIRPWLLDACVQASGDVAEAVAHLLPAPPHEDPIGPRDALALLDTLRDLTHAAQRAQRLLQRCESLEVTVRECLLRLALGRWRRVVGDALLRDSLAAWAGIDPRIIHLRWADFTESAVPRLDTLVAPRLAAWHADALPWPFAAIEPADATQTHDPSAHIVRSWHGGQPVQLVRRTAGCWLWSAAGELLNAASAELLRAAASLPPDTVLQGEWLGGGAPELLVHDVLQWAGDDVRSLAYTQRWALWPSLRAGRVLRAATAHGPADPQAIAALHAQARQRGLRGLLLQRRDAAHGTPLATRLWLAPALTLRAVVQSMQWGEGPSGDVGIELGLALWRQRGEGLPALARLPDPHDTDAVMALWAPIAKVWIDAADAPDVDGLTLQRFGPLRLLKPALVCEVQFDALVRNPRRRSGATLRGAVFGAWRHEATLQDVDEVASLMAWLPAAQSNGTDQGS